MDANLDDARVEPQARPRGGWLSGGAIVLAVGASLALADVAAADSAPSLGELRSAFASKAPPGLEWQEQGDLSLTIKAGPGHVDGFGRCRRGRPVVISGNAVGEPVRAECAAGTYTARVHLGAADGDEMVASQLLLDGTIIAARHATPVRPRREQEIVPTQLNAALSSAAPGDRLVLRPGTYANVKVDLPAGKGGTSGSPVVIDGDHAVTLTGATQLKIAGGHVVLRRLKFQDAGAATIIVTGPNIRITESEFTGCGDPRRPQAECLLIMEGGARLELDFNTFAGSLSMSIKLRAGPDISSSQPVHASIHHNIFRDILRRSDNGQEPIQIAGPGGGGSNVSLRTRVEHNLFFHAEGDREAISIKAPGVSVRWNAFRDMDAAPNFRGSPDNALTENVLIRTRSIRIAGRNNQVTGNILLCPHGGVGLLISHGSPGYEAAINNVIRDNVVAATKTGVLFAAQTQPLETLATANVVTGNTFHLSRSGPVVEVLPETAAAAVRSGNTLSATPSGQKLCP
jgi:Chondroitinase B